jgi:hypothetical protein
MCFLLQRKPKRQQVRPSTKHSTEARRIERCEYRQKNVLGRSTMGQLQKLAQPVLMRFAPQLHGLGVIGAADHRHQRNDDDASQRIASSLCSSRVAKLRQGGLKERQGLLLVLLL